MPETFIDNGPAGVRAPRAIIAGRLGQACIAECAGTFILVFFGIGAVHAGVLASAHSGLFQVAMVWGIGVTLGIYATAAISGAHLNPAMTAAFAVAGGFPKKDVLPYWGSQVLGGFLAAAVIYGIFGGLLKGVETRDGITRGAAGSEKTAMCYGEYFPNPRADLAVDVTETGAILVEFTCTAVLAFIIFALTENANRKAPGPLAPLFIGLTVTALISLVAPLTQACFNPARDFGPRLFAYFAGWGNIAIPGPRGGFFTVYILAPIAGAVFGALTFRLTVKAGYLTADSSKS